jgi:type II secretory pathway pseudopilin PulG
MRISVYPALKKRVSTKVSWSTKGEAGFTLLETAAVLLLVVLLASLIFPHFDLAYCKWQENTALLQILRDLKEAESEAAGTGREIRLVFHSGRPYYLLEMGGEVLRRPLPGLSLAGEEEAEDEKTVIKFGKETPEEQMVVLLGAGDRVYRVLAAKGRPPEVLVDGEDG